MKRKVLVTGATGFIGSHVVTHLLSLGHQVIATSAHVEKAMQMPWFDAVTYVPFQLEMYDSIVDYYSYFGRPDQLIHLAWEGLPNYKAAFHIDENLPRHQAFLQNMVTNGLTDLTVVGTCFEYGFQEGCLHESLPSKPANAYSIAKNSLREYLEKIQLLHGFNLKWARLFYMYGKGQNPNSLLAQLEQALVKGDSVFNMSGGEQLRDFLPVEKMSEYIVKIALQQSITGIINCCSGNPISVKQLVLDYLSKRNASIDLNLGFYPYPDYEPMHFWGDVHKLKQVSGIE